MPKQILTMISRQMSVSSPSGSKTKVLLSSGIDDIANVKQVLEQMIHAFFVQGLTTVVIHATDTSTERESLTLKTKRSTW